MRARRRKEAEMKNVKRKTNEENFLPEEIIKIDPDENPDEGKVAKSVQLQSDREKHLFPLRIDSRTVIYVPEHLNNETYKRAWMDKVGVPNASRDASLEESRAKSASVRSDRELVQTIKSMLKEGFSSSEIAEKLFLSRRKVQGLICTYKLRTLKSAERAKVLAGKGLSNDEICKRMSIKMSTLKRML